MNRSPLLCLALVGVLVGCRTGGVPAPEPLQQVIAKDPLLSRSQERTKPALAARLGVTPIRVSYDPTELFPPTNAAQHGSVPNVRRVRKELVDALVELNLFQRVESRGAEEADPSTVARQAWDARDDLVLELNLRSYHQSYLGHANYLTWFLLYVNLVWPAWFVEVDLYGVGLELEVRLRSIQEDAPPLLERTYVIKPEETAKELTSFDRELAGFLDLGALWNVETSLEESNWQAIDRGVGPHAWQRLFVHVLRDLEAEIGGPLAGAVSEQEEVLRKVRKRFALVVGVSSHADASLGTVANAVGDAQAVAEFLGSPEGGGLAQGRDMLLLLDSQAGRAPILEALATLGSRATSNDEILIYVAGQGTTLEGAEGTQACLLPHDALAKNLAGTGLSLADLGQALASLPAQVVLFLDASFAGARAGGRTHPGPAGLAPTVEELTRDLGIGTGRRTALFAAGGGQAAGELVQARSGLFSQALVGGLRGEADTDEDGRVKLGELADYLRTVVPRHAGLEGYEQTPQILGLDAKSSALGWPR